MSQGSVIVSPAPIETPLIAAMIGFERWTNDTQFSRRSRDAHAVAVLFGALDALVPALDVRPGAEALARAGQHDRADGRVVVIRLDRLAHLGVHRLAEGVQLVRVVQRDDADAAAFFGEYLFVWHGVPPFAGGDDYSTERRSQDVRSQESGDSSVPCC